MSHELPRIADSTPDVPPHAARPGSWLRMLVALVALWAYPLLWMLIAPVREPLMMVVPILATLALLAWWLGGRLPLALALIVLAAYALTKWPFVALARVPPTVEFQSLVKGWAILVAATFGLVGLLAPRRPFFPRAMATIGIALTIGVIMLALAGTSGVQLVDAVDREYGRRLNALLTSAVFEAWATAMSADPQAAAGTDQIVSAMRMMVHPAARLLPAFLALETLAVLTAAYALFHRLSRVRVGPVLGPLSEFRFGDQFVWGIIVGLVTTLFPSLANLRTFGVNLLVFFGVLYALRGIGVVAWYFSPGPILLTLIVFVSFFATPLVGALALALGLGDTWLDWRSRGRAAT